MEIVVDQISKHCRELIEQDGKFGSGRKFVKFEIDPAKQGKDQFASAAIFGDIVFEDASQTPPKTSAVPVVIKTEPPMPGLREFFNSPLQFHNEILFYSKFLPFLNSFQNSPGVNFAKFLKGATPDPVLLSYVILENASKDGFRLSSDKQLLNLDHFLMAVNRLGRFHALSYIAKHQDRTTFDQLTGQIKECSWTDERLANGNAVDGDLVHSVTRGIRKFDNSVSNEHSTSDGRYQDQVDKLKKMIFKCPTRFMRDITSPKEPMAVLCHGDFCRNNILFQYAEGNNTKEDSPDTSSPTDVLFFDMATIRYSSPVIDLSFFIYLNSNPEIRQHWDKILDSYHQGVKANVVEYADRHQINVIEGKSSFTSIPSSSSAGIFLPSLADVHNEFTYYAIYGYMHCSFFLPAMLEKGPLKFEIDEAGEQVQWWNMPAEMRYQIQDATGGEEGTKALNDLVQHMFDMKFV